MAEIYQDESEQKVFPREPCDKTLFLNSIKKHQPNGVQTGVEKSITPKKNNFGKISLNCILRVIGEMPKMIQYELDEDGQYISYEDDITGETKRKLKIGEGQMATIFFPFYAKQKDEKEELDDFTTLIITPGTSSYSFFREALINDGQLPSDMGNQAIATNYAEIKEALDGFTFLAKYEEIKGGNRKFPSLKVERLEEEEL